MGTEVNAEAVIERLGRRIASFEIDVAVKDTLIEQLQAEVQRLSAPAE